MEVIGLDIGTSYIKAVSIDKTKYRILKKIALTPTGDIYNKINSTDDKVLNEAALDLKKFFKDNGFTADRIVGILPDDVIYTKVINMPYLEGAELTNAVQWEAEQYIPQPINQVHLKYTILNDTKNDIKEKSIIDEIKLSSNKNKAPQREIEVLVVAAPKNIVNRYVSVFTKMGLEPLGLEPASVSTIRSVTFNDASIPSVIVNFGYNRVSFYLAVNNTLRFVRTINFALSSVIGIIKKELDLSDINSNEYLFTYGLKENELNGKLKEVILPVINIILDELKKSISFVESKERLIGVTDNKVKRIILTGGGALIPNLLVYFAEQINTEIEISRTWENIDTNEIKEKHLIDSLGPVFPAAVGAALMAD
jgi:type IV pilus assembly protein PilM